MELILIRHGESLGNYLKGEDAVYTGRWDCDLTELGYEQAKKVIGSPLLENIDAWYCSNLKRAIETAKTITDRDLIIDPRLQERSHEYGKRSKNGDNDKRIKRKHRINAKGFCS